MLRLVADVQALQNTRSPERGIPTYAGNLARQSLKLREMLHSLSLNPSRPLPMDLHPDLLNSGKLRWGSTGLLKEAAGQGRLVYWILSVFEQEATLDTLMPRRIVAEGGRIVITLYDLIPLIFPDRFFSKQWSVSPAIRRQFDNSVELLKMADLILSISEHTASDAARLLGIPRDRMAVAGTGVSDFFNPDQGIDSDRRLIRDALPDLSTAYLFTVLGDDPRKNAEALIAAYSLLPKSVSNEFALVIGGRYSDFAIDHLLQAVPPPLRRRVYFPRHLSMAALRALYRSAALFVFPSLYEGFGLPVAEAIECGCPVVCANNSSLPELVEYEEALFDAADPASIGECLIRGLRDRNVRDRLKAYSPLKRGSFEWAQVADRCFQAIERFASPRRCLPLRSRPAIALAGPFPPERTGIADVNFRLAGGLSEVADLYIFYTGKCDAAALLENGAVECLPMPLLGRAVSPQYLDGIVYTIGNSHHHLETIEKVLQYPGLLWFHDTHVAELFRVYHRQGQPDLGGFRDQAKRAYNDRCPPLIETDRELHPRTLQRAGIHLTSSLLQASRGVIVSSYHSLQMLTMDQRPLLPLPPTWILPLPSKMHTSPLRPAPPRPGETRVIATFGFVGDGKEPELLIEAAGLLARRLPLELVFVGEADPVCSRSLHQRAAAVGLEGRVYITGFIDEAGWTGHLTTSHCAVQLRTISNGESSGAVADCLSAGLPVITSLLSYCRMPDDALLFVPGDATPQVLCDAMLRVLDDTAEWQRLHEGALRYSAEHTPLIAARKIVDILLNLPESAGNV